MQKKKKRYQKFSLLRVQLVLFCDAKITYTSDTSQSKNNCQKSKQTVTLTKANKQTKNSWCISQAMKTDFVAIFCHFIYHL